MQKGKEEKENKKKNRIAVDQDELTEILNGEERE